MKKAKRPTTVETIKARCEIVGECWIWSQGAPSGSPMMRHDGKAVLVRRLVLELATGVAVPRGILVSSSECCSLCCNPAHLKRLNGAQFMALMNKRGHINGPAQHAKRTAAVRACATTKLTVETATQVRELIAAGHDRGEVAKQFGITRRHANRVAVGSYWGDSTRPAQSSVFALAASVSGRASA